jgi:PEP-CTERM motif
VVRRVLTVLLGAVLLVGAGSARATLLSVDQIIYESALGTTVTPSLLSGTIDVTASGSTLTILLTNTSPDGAFVGGGAPSTMLLSGFGIQLPGVNVTGGTVEVNGGSTALNFGAQSTSVLGNQWMYANASIDGFSSISGVLATDTIATSVNNGAGTRFIGPPPTTIDGPDFGALSAAETEFGASQEGVQDTIKFILNLDGTAPSESTINAGNVVLAFGSPAALVPEPTTLVMLGGGLVGLVAFGRRNLRA